MNRDWQPNPKLPHPWRSSGVKMATVASCGCYSSHRRLLAERRRSSFEGPGPHVCAGYFAGTDLKTSVLHCVA